MSEIIIRPAGLAVIQEALLRLAGRSSHRSTANIYAGVWQDFAAFLRAAHDGYSATYWRARPWAASHTERRELLDYLNEVMPSVTTTDVNAYRLAMLREPKIDRLGRRKIGLEHSTVNGHLAALRYLWRVAVQLGVCSHNPAEAGMVPRHKTSRAYKPEAFTAEELEALLFGDYPDTPKGRRDRMLLQFLGFTGTRREEVAGLHVADLRRVQAGLCADLVRKGDKRQLVLLPERLEGLLAAYFEVDNAREFVFPSYRGQEGLTGLAVNTVTNIIRENTERILGKPRGPHVLRHTFITLAINNGATLPEVQRYVGHSSPTTTMQYFSDIIVRERSAAEFILKEKS